MDSFTVRVYRCAVGSRGEPAGTVERVGGGEPIAFTDRAFDATGRLSTDGTIVRVERRTTDVCR